jgi:glutathione peroxidase
MSIYDFEVQTMQGETRKLDSYKGKVLLIANTASKCGFTPQLAGLETLHEKYAERGLVVLGFPCNQFGGQDPGSDREILDFCVKNYGVSFPMHSKIEVNGNQASPLFQYLKKEAKGALGTERIKWNFTKFLVSKDGEVLKRFAPLTKPEDIQDEIERALAA